MTFDEVVQHFGSIAEVHKRLNISKQAVYYWKKRNAVPLASQFLLERMTEGALVATVPVKPPREEQV